MCLCSHRAGLRIEIDIQLERMISSMDANHSFNQDFSFTRGRNLAAHPRGTKANKRIAIALQNILVHASVARGVPTLSAGRVYFYQTVSRAISEVEVNDSLFSLKVP